MATRDNLLLEQAMRKRDMLRDQLWALSADKYIVWSKETFLSLNPHDDIIIGDAGYVKFVVQQGNKTRYYRARQTQGMIYVENISKSQWGKLPVIGREPIAGDQDGQASTGTSVPPEAKVEV